MKNALTDSTCSIGNFEIRCHLTICCEFGKGYLYVMSFTHCHINDLTSFDLNGLKLFPAQCCILYRNQSFDLQWKSNDWGLNEMQHLAQMG